MFFFSFSYHNRGLFESVDAQTAPTTTAAQSVTCRTTQHHVPDIRLSARLCHLLLPQWCNMFYHQNWRIHPLQLRVSTTFLYSSFVVFFSCYLPLSLSLPGCWKLVNRCCKHVDCQNRQGRTGLSLTLLLFLSQIGDCGRKNLTGLALFSFFLTVFMLSSTK